MKHFYFILIAGTIATSQMLPPVLAQHNRNRASNIQAPDSLQGKTVIIPIGTTMEGRMDSTIGSALSQDGERFTITMSSPVLANGTDVLIPAGSKILGEVVEAIPHTQLTRMKGGPVPTGKLRIQLTALRTPDGMTYPMVCSLTAENIFMGKKQLDNPMLGNGVGFVGTSSSFEAESSKNGGPQTAQQMMRDPIYGVQASVNSLLVRGTYKPSIRALVKRNNELFIDSGSAVSIKLNAPFKMAITAAGTPGEALPVLDPDEPPPPAGHRFSRDKREVTPEPFSSSAPPNTNGSTWGLDNNPPPSFKQPPFNSPPPSAPAAPSSSGSQGPNF